MGKFTNHYCPVCLTTVDPETGDHWHYCEYESSYGDWVNPVQPLTELQMFEKKLEYKQADLKSLNAQKRELQKQIKIINEKMSVGIA